MALDKEAFVKQLNESLAEKFDPLNTRMGEMEKKVEAMDKITEPIITKGDPDNWKEAFGKSLHDLITGEKTVVTISDVAGTVPETWIREVFNIPCDYGAFLQSGPRIVPIAEIVNLAKKHATTNVGLTWKSQGSGEGIEEGVTEGKTTKVPLQRDRLIANVPISNESKTYSYVTLVNYFTDRLREEWNGELDNQALNGNTDPFVGILNTAGISQVQFDATKTEFSDIKRKYLIRAMGQCAASVRGTAGWFVHNSVLHTVHEYCVDTNGRPLFNYETNKLMGYPVWATDKMGSTSGAGTDMMIFGSTRIGMAYATSGFSVALSEHAEFKKDNLVLRTTGDVALGVILEKAFCKITTAAA